MYAFISLAEEVMSTKTTTLLIAILLTGNLFAGDDPDTSSARSNNVVLTLGLSSAGIEERAFVAADDYCPYLECPIIFPCERRFLSDGRIQFRECSIIMKTVSADPLGCIIWRRSMPTSIPIRPARYGDLSRAVAGSAFCLRMDGQVFSTVRFSTVLL